ncbi:MAG: radical SAM protein [Planctomycetales bacterium]|nr:radical SAM protein [Planctomycetales bacterium]
MHVVLWDTRQLDVSKDFAGGFGVGQYHGQGGVRGKIVRWFYRRDHRPVALNFAYLAAIFRELGHSVEYVEDATPPAADVYVFNPSLITLAIEKRQIAEVRQRFPHAKVLITGLVGYALPEAFADLGVTIVRGEAEQLRWKLDDVLASDAAAVDVGSVKDLDALPYPDWSAFQHRRFKIGYDFTRFPTALIQQSRGCTFTCNYCPYIIVENATRFREPDNILAEMRHGIERYGFRSFKFRDPLFGLDRKRVLRLAEGIGKLPRKIQFSIESRIDLMRPETLRTLREVGLTSITVGIETPDDDTLRAYKRAPIKDDRQRAFVAECRALGIRTVAGFMIGFPEDTEKSIRYVLKYAKKVNPTYANFNIVTPYPGTEFFGEVRDQVADFDYSKYTVYTPVMKYKHLTSERVAELHAKCFTSYYFRWLYLRDNAHLLWPITRLVGFGRVSHAAAASASTPLANTQSAEPSRPATRLPVIQQGGACRTDEAHGVPTGHTTSRQTVQRDTTAES